MLVQLAIIIGASWLLAGVVDDLVNNEVKIILSVEYHLEIPTYQAISMAFKVGNALTMARQSGMNPNKITQFVN